MLIATYRNILVGLRKIDPLEEIEVASVGEEVT
jgi:hypothetical protein